MQGLRSFKVWFFQFTVGVVLAGSVLYFGVLHLGMKVPLRSLIAPWLTLSLLLVTLASPIYYSIRYARASGGDLRPLCAVIGGVMLMCSLVIFHYASKLGLLSPEAARGSSITSLIAIPPCTLVAYYVSRSFARPTGPAKEGTGDGPSDKGP